MIRILLVVPVALMLAGGAAAQDATGNVDPSAYSLPTVMQSAINAQAKSGRKGARPALSPRARQVCADLPKTRARLGPGDGRVREISRLCREAGYPG